ncbi:MAG TPA: diacylglycerol kinase [Nitrospiraceae bacterium]|nr:diacylglycerol kinase [Nitrospiraceae bacterium]
MNDKPSPKTGLARIWAALFYSLHGLRFSIYHVVAFQQEVCLFVVLLIVLYFLPISIVFKCILLFANTTVLIAELLNSAIESIVDMTSPDYHVLAKQAKDLGSAAVLISLLLAIVLWGSAIYFMLNRGSG